MKIIFENEGRRYEAEGLENIDTIYEAIRDGLVAMSYHRNTANDLVTDLKDDVEY